MYAACIDIGGTFTDLVLHHEEHGLEIFKSPTTPDAFEIGFIDVLGLAAESHGMELGAFLEATDLIVHGTTVSTNALVEGKVAPVGLLVTKGHPDILTLRESPRKRAFDMYVDYPDPFVPRNLTFEIGGRIDSLGNVIDPLSEDDVIAVAELLKKSNVEAVAVSLLWSIVNPAHERRVREILEDKLPGMPITLSHELNPIPREYRRTISAAINASLYPTVASYTAKLSNVLREAGYRNELLIANCVGGMMPPDDIVKRPIYSVMSGPTLAPIAALHLCDHKDVIVIDMGGTTFDVSAIRDRQLVVTPEATTGADMLGIPKVDVRSVGAGGGSIAWVDQGGLLKVGPRSASSKPGPACYGAGGTEPTVTDANVVLGIIDPDYFLGGRMKLDAGKAQEAVGKIADKLGVGLVEAAYAIHTTSNHTMITAVESITINEGIDPRDSYLVCGGGATSCHIGEMARILGTRQFMIPSFAAGLSAFGGLISDVRWEESATAHTLDGRFDFDRVNAAFEVLLRNGRKFLDEAGLPREKQRFEFSFQGRYLYQSWDIEVPFELPAAGLGPDDLPALVEAFHAMHERIYTIKDPDDTVEFTTWKVRAIGDSGGAQRFAYKVAGERTETASAGTRKVYIHDRGGMSDTPVYSGKTLSTGAVVQGPAVIEEETTTILLLPNQVATMDAKRNYLVEAT